MPFVTVVSPSWIEVEKATIFLMSFLVRVYIAVNNVVMAPKYSVIVLISLLFSTK